MQNCFHIFEGGKKKQTVCFRIEEPIRRSQKYRSTSENHEIGFQTHRPRRVPRRNCGPCSSCRCTWRTVPPAGLPASSGIPAQTCNGLIKLAVIKNRSEDREGDGFPFRNGGGRRKSRRADRSRSVFTVRRAFPKAPGVNRGRIICGTV